MTRVEKANSGTYAYLLMTMLLLIHFWIFPLSLQYTPVFIISLLGIVAVIAVHQHHGYRLSKMVLLFFTIGSVTNFFDLLTVPLLTFAFPWMIYFVLVNQHHRRHFKHNLSETVILGWTWFMGYGLTWASKWAIGSVILIDNLFANVANQIALRTAGKTDEVLDAIEIIKNMWKILLPKTAMIIVVIWLIILLVQSFKRGQELSTLVKHNPIIDGRFSAIYMDVYFEKSQFSLCLFYLSFIYHNFVFSIYLSLSNFKATK